MKRFTFLTIFLLLSAVMVKAQIPNADFENWTNGNPDGWWVSNFSGVIQTITKTTDAQHGKAAVKGEVVSYANIVWLPVIQTYDSDSVEGFPVAKRYVSFAGYYKFMPVQDDSMLMGLAMYKNGGLIGGGSVKLSPTDSYKRFTASIKYYVSETPDTCAVYIEIFNHAGQFNVHPGSVMYIDNLSFGSITAVEDHAALSNSFGLSQNYPNPFTQSTTIKYKLSSTGFVTLTVYNLLGKKVKTLVNKTQNTGEHEVTADLNLFTSGVYFYRINVKSENGKQFTSFKKMILKK